MFHHDSFESRSLIVVNRAGPSTLMVPGSFVRLRSGGPIGVIIGIDQDDRATVTWLTSPPVTRVISDVCLSPSFDDGARPGGASSASP